MRRFWTEAEIELVRDAYSPGKAPAIAKKLGRSLSSVHQRISKLGLTKPHTRCDEAFLAEVVRMHSEGMTDPEIASALGAERHTVNNHRKALGLPSNQTHERYRSRVAEKTAVQLAAIGVPNLGRLRAEIFARVSEAAGWPTGLRIGHVSILNTLLAKGPMTRRDLAEAIGMPWKGSRKSLVSNDPEGTYLAHLIAVGLVVSLGRVIRGEGRGKSVQLYDLTMNARKDVAL